MIDGSTGARAEVESLCTQTGQYRFVLRGTLEMEARRLQKERRQAAGRNGSGIAGSPGGKRPLGGALENGDG